MINIAKFIDKVNSEVSPECEAYLRLLYSGTSTAVVIPEVGLADSEESLSVFDSVTTVAEMSLKNLDKHLADLAEIRRVVSLLCEASACPGCHGTMRWCDDCGDVSDCDQNKVEGIS